VKQEKDWMPMQLPDGPPTCFLHCGSAPLTSKGGTGLLLKYAKENVKVKGYPNAPRKWILAFPLLKDADRFAQRPFRPEQTIHISKPAQNLWSETEMRSAFLFQIMAGPIVWTFGAKLSEVNEVGIPFDLIFEDTLIAEYERVDKHTARLVDPLAAMRRARAMKFT
jgi:hypothetical protein